MKDGKIGTITTMFAIVELFWVIVSCAAVIVFFQRKNNALAPISFLVYNIIGWCLSAVLPFLLSKQGHGITLTEGMVYPQWIFYIGMVFGLYFLSINGWMLRKFFKEKKTI